MQYQHVRSITREVMLNNIKLGFDWKIKPDWRKTDLDFVDYVESGLFEALSALDIKTGNDIVRVWETKGFRHLRARGLSPFGIRIIQGYMIAGMAYEQEILGYVEDSF